MKTLLSSTLALLFLLASLATITGLAAPQKQAGPTAVNEPKQPKPALETYHAGPWEQRIGYSQAVRSGHMLYISGTVGVNSEGKPDDLDSQMKNAYAVIQKRLAHYKSDASYIV